MGGALTGLPLSSGPVSVFLLVEQGRGFAATAARASILGLVGVAAFSVAYSRVAARGPLVALAVGFVAYLLTTAAIRPLDLGVFGTAAFAASALGIALLVIPVPRAAQSAAPPPKWDLPMRMLVATAMVLAITTAASALGATWSGLLSPFPVFTSVLAAFSHTHDGSAAAIRIQRGVVIGVFAFAAFFVVVALLVTTHSAVVTYAVATIVAVAINAVCLWMLRGGRGQS